MPEPKRPGLFALLQSERECSPSDESTSPSNQVFEVTPAVAKQMTKRELFLASFDAARLLRRAVQDIVVAAPVVATVENPPQPRVMEPTSTQVRAAIAVLDRSGFGPTSTISLEDTDLSNLSKQQLMERLELLKSVLQERMNDDAMTVN